MVRLSVAVVAVLVLALLVGFSAGAQTLPSRCATAWNKSAPSVLRERVMAANPRGAFINPNGSSVMSVSWTKTSQSTRTAPGCSIQFVLRNGRSMVVWGALANGGVQKWFGPVKSSGAIPLPINTNVHTDGTVGFHG